MKKAFYFLAATVLAVIMTACSTDDQEPSMDIIPEGTYDVNSIQARPADPLAQFMVSLDSLNAKYPGHVSRGRNDLLVSAADNLGRRIGEGIDKKAKTKGVFAPLVEALFSAVAEIVNGKDNGSEVPEGQMILAYDNSIKVSEMEDMAKRSDDDIIIIGGPINPTLIVFPDDPTPVFPVRESIHPDSMGYYHNSVMVMINQIKGSYSGLFGYALVDAVLNDIVDSYTQLGYDFSNEATDSEVHSQLVSIASEIAQISVNCYYMRLPLRDGIQEMRDYIRIETQFSDSNDDYYDDFLANVLAKCQSLTVSQIHEYAEDLNNLLINSDMPDETRVELGYIAESAINSSLCWMQCK